MASARPQPHGSRPPPPVRAWRGRQLSLARQLTSPPLAEMNAMAPRPRSNSLKPAHKHSPAEEEELVMSTLRRLLTAIDSGDYATYWCAPFPLELLRTPSGSLRAG